MACKGTCEFRVYRFRTSTATGKKTVIEPSPAGAKPLTDEEIRTILQNYFEPIRLKHCKTCAADCECVPSLEDLAHNTEWTARDLPEPIVATSGSDTYTIKGAVEVGAKFYKGACTQPFDSNLQKKPKPAGRDFTLGKIFKPKPGTADCQCRCERQTYNFRGTDATTVTPKGAAPPIDPNKLNQWIADQLKDHFGKDYPDEDLEDCNNGCTCVLDFLTEVLGDWRVVNIAKPARVTVVPDVTQPAKSFTYEITGQYEVRPLIYKGVCIPDALLIEAG